MTASTGRRRTAVAAATALFALAAVLIALANPKPASAAQLTEITDFGDNPGNLQMYVYIPDNVAPEPAVLVGVHWCTGSGPDFYNGTQFDELAEQYGYIVVYPSVTRESKCFDVSSPASLSGDGGDSASIKSMVDYALAEYGADADRIYASGTSSGAMMTNVLLGVYPEIFKAGSAYAGVPFTCFATDNGSEWNSECSNGGIDRTPAEWGDAVRDANPGYAGPWPRMQLWHGTEDDVLRYPNFNEMIEQWTNVHGLGQSPDFTDNPQANWTRTRYGDTGGQAPVEAISMQGTGHNLPHQAAETIRFFGLDQDGGGPTTPPETSEPPGDADCTAAIDVAGDWGSGWQGNVSVTAGSADISGWTLTWTWPGGQSITSSWNADVSSSGSTVTAADAGWNGAVAAGQTRQTWGFIGSGPAVSPEVTCAAA